MTETQVNIPLLRKAVEWAEAEAVKPEIDREWYQDLWLSDPEDMAWGMLGDTPAPRTDRVLEQVAAHCGTAYCIAGYVAQLVDPRYVGTDSVDGIRSSQVAADALGLSRRRALFDGDNTIADIRRIAEDIAGERL